jgi:hypothetical protein
MDTVELDEESIGPHVRDEENLGKTPKRELEANPDKLRAALGSCPLCRWGLW